MEYNREVSYGEDYRQVEFYIELFGKAHPTSKTLECLEDLERVLMNGPSPEFYENHVGRDIEDEETQEEIQNCVETLMKTFDEEFPDGNSTQIFAGLVN